MDAQAQQGAAVLKLVAFSALMWFVPAALYYSSLRLQDVAHRPQLYGYLGVAAVNLVVVAYIVSALREKPVAPEAKRE